MSFYRQFMEPSDTVFDIGANIGQRSIEFAKLCKRVLAVEPSIGSFRALLTAAEGHPILPINKALGAKCGNGTLLVSKHNATVGTSSMSPAWIEAVRKSKRFSADYWDGQQECIVTTLDMLIEDFGEPSFIKIDVEGYEYEVLRGLSTPVWNLCFEFVRERLDAAKVCVQRCSDLGVRHFNLSLMEDFRLGVWTDADGIMNRVERLPDDGVSYGDIFAAL